jgi:hypothetical protein
VNALLDEHIGHVAARINDLRQLEKQLKALRDQCVGPRSAEHCGILNELAHAAGVPRAPAAVHEEHVRGSHGRATRNAAAPRR